MSIHPHSERAGTGTLSDVGTPEVTAEERGPCALPLIWNNSPTYNIPPSPTHMPLWGHQAWAAAVLLPLAEALILHGPQGTHSHPTHPYPVSFKILHPARNVPQQTMPRIQETRRRETGKEVHRGLFLAREAKYFTSSHFRILTFLRSRAWDAEAADISGLFRVVPLPE